MLPSKDKVEINDSSLKLLQDKVVWYVNTASVCFIRKKPLIKVRLLMFLRYTYVHLCY